MDITLVELGKENKNIVALRGETYQRLLNQSFSQKSFQIDFLI